MQTSQQSYNVVITGAPSVGKSTYIRRLLTGEYTKVYKPTLHHTVYEYDFHTNHGVIHYSIHEHRSDIQNCDAVISIERREELEAGTICTSNGSLPIIYQSRSAARTCRTIETPFVLLARAFTGHQDLYAVPSPPFTPPTIPRRALIAN